MSKLMPAEMLEKVYDITPALLRSWGVRALLLDVDNTLTTHNNPDIHPKVKEWLDLMRENGIELMVLSNNTTERVRKFADALKLDYVGNALKPRRSGFQRAVRKLGLPPAQIAMVGDQLFTDVWGANRCGLRSVLVKPFNEQESGFIRFKRVLERGVVRWHEGKQSKTGR